jgi:ribosomal protein S18 acetylase RimI-like enzyme
MQIVPLRAEHVPALHPLYLDAVGGALHCRFTPDAERFAAELLHPEGPVEMLVAEDAGGVRGFAAIAKLDDEDAEEARQATEAITALYFADEEAGRALIAACEARASGDRLAAFPPTHNVAPLTSFSAGWNGLTDRAAPIARLLARSGYTPFFRELHLTCDIVRNAPLEIAPPEGVTIVAEQGKLGNLVQRARAGEREVGACWYNTIAAIGKIDDPAAARVGHVMWMHVEEDMRRRGIARLLMARMFSHLRAIGCDECWLTTTADNWPAQALYLGLGYEICDTSAAFLKLLN